MRKNHKISRRQVLKQVSLLIGGAVSAPLMSYAVGIESKPTQDVDEALAAIKPFEKLLSVVAEMIIPTTDTPGAIGAGVPEFIKLMLSAWYDKGERQRFMKRLSVFDDVAIKLGHRSFVSASHEDKVKILEQLDRQGRNSIFAEIKELTVFGYYTSEAATQELNYSPIPAGYKACIPLKDVGRTWLQTGI